MRNMSFMLTTKQMYERTKTVTRRVGWWTLKPGDVVMAVEKSQGLKKGDKVKPIYPIRIISVRREPLHWITDTEVVSEGFDGMTTDEFVDMFCKTHECGPLTEVNRIVFEEVENA